ncbi:MAG: ATP-binding cassette, subfamily bacterial, partial [Frankiaceae bacterium]|nr:ATP-binding cassette, subfamily bacterial [Frankiaceae bacterium]
MRSAGTGSPADDRDGSADPVERPASAPGHALGSAPSPTLGSAPLPLTWRRLQRPAAALALGIAVSAAALESLGAVIAGRLAGPAAAVTWAAIGFLALTLIGSAACDTVARTIASDVVAGAEGSLRGDLLHAALSQSLPALQEQAVGELIDRIDDDVTQVGRLSRRTGWEMGRSALRSVAAWLVAGFAWPAAWLVFPVVGFLVFLAARPLAPLIARRKLAEEVAWSDHAAQLEEAVAGRDDIRSSLGQAHVVRQYARRARTVLDRTAATATVSATVMRRCGLVLHGMLAAIVVAGVALVSDGHLDRPTLVTLWLLTATFVGSVNQVAHHVPEVQAALGALARIRLLLATPQEDAAGAPLPDAPASVEFRDLTFAYDDGGFALSGIDLLVPAGTTTAVVGRTGSGKSTLSSFLSRALEPPAGSVFVAGQDVRDTDLGELRRAVGVVTQRTEI